MKSQMLGDKHVTKLNVFICLFVDKLVSNSEGKSAKNWLAY